MLRAGVTAAQVEHSVLRALGEAEALTGAPYSYSVVTATDCKLLYIHKFQCVAQPLAIAWCWCPRAALTPRISDGPYGCGWRSWDRSY
jgi:hypothetical protein